jgi:hypothetical protein
MNQNTRLIITALATILITISSTAIARAHTITTADCRSAASAAATHQQWQSTYRACKTRSARHSYYHACKPPRPTITIARVKGHRANRHQLRVISRTLTVGRKYHAPRNVQIAAITAITQESNATNIRHGHGTSVGILQLINTHGSIKWRLVIENSAGWFYRGARQVRTRHQAPGTIAQSVQRSGHPRAYHQWTSEATRTVQRWYGPCRN